MRYKMCADDVGVLRRWVLCGLFLLMVAREGANRCSASMATSVLLVDA